MVEYQIDRVPNSFGVDVFIVTGYNPTSNVAVHRFGPFATYAEASAVAWPAPKAKLRRG